MSAFKELGLCEQLLEACAKVGWSTPTEIQTQSIPWALKGRDVIALAQTGSGKTGAFALPILEALLKNPQPLFAVVISPTRELAVQISEHFDALGAGVNLRCATIVGGFDEMTQMRTLAKKPHVIVATPGRLLHHLQTMKGFSLKSLKFLVLDEADRLLNMEFEKDLDSILEVLPKERQTFLFSATMTSKVRKLQRASLKDPVRIEVASKYQTVDTLKQQYLLVPHIHKDVYLIHMLNEMAGNTTIIFVCTKINAQRLQFLTKNLGFSSVAIHGNMTQANRMTALEKFKSGQKSILIATDVCSRGIDIPSVELVINYEIPRNSKDYIHRVGRTARAGRSGRAVTIVTQYDVELYQRIEDLIGKQLETFETDEDEVMLMQQRVAEASRFAGQELRDCGMFANIEDGDEEDDGGMPIMGKKKGNNNKKRAFGGKPGGGGGGSSSSSHSRPDYTRGSDGRPKIKKSRR